MHKDLLKEVVTELNMLACNVDLENDEFALKEVQLIQSLLTLLEETQTQLQSHGLGQDQKEINKAQELWHQIESLYTDTPSLIRVHFDGNPKHLARIANALSDKKDTFSTKKIQVKRPVSNTPFLSEFQDFFPEPSNSPDIKENNSYVSTPRTESEIVQTIKDTEGAQKALEKAVCFIRKIGAKRQVAALLIDEKSSITQACSGSQSQSPITKDTHFRIGSLSKFITGMAVIRLLDTNPKFKTDSGQTRTFSQTTTLSDIFSTPEPETIFSPH